MVARETNIVNAFETTLAAQLAQGGTSMNLTADPGVDSPAYFVIDPDNDSNREVVLWSSGTNHAAATVVRDMDGKHGTAEDASTAPTHAAGTKVRLAVVKQHIQEAHDAIQQGFVLEDGDGTEVTINPAVASGVYTAREVKFVEGGGIDINWTDTDNGTDADPYDLTFTVNVDTAEIAADAITEAKIADDAVESEHLNDNVISGQTDLASGLALTDELLISDAGTLKKGDVSLLAEAIDGAGLTDNSGVLDVDLNDVGDATVNVANDSIAIIDADASNATKKETVADLVSAIAGTNLTASSGQLNASAGGITMIDVFKLTADITATDGDITSNLARVSYTGFSQLDTGMTESSGIFTFPATGFYEVTIQPNLEINNDPSAEVLCVFSNDNFSSETNVAGASMGNRSATGAHFYQFEKSVILDITNVSTHKVKFKTASFASASILFDDNTRFVFKKLADT